MSALDWASSVQAHIRQSKEQALTQTRQKDNRNNKLEDFLLGWERRRAL